MAHTEKPDFVFRRNGRVHLNRQGPQFTRLLAAVVCASEVVMLDSTYSEVVWGVLATHSIRQFHLHFSSRASPCAITFQLDSTNQQIPLNRDSNEKPVVAQFVKKFLFFYEIHCKLSFSEKSNIWLYPESVKPTPEPHTLLLTINFNIILQSATSRSNMAENG